MLFKDAYKELMSGKKIARTHFEGYWFLDQETGRITIHLKNGKDITYGNLGLTIKNCAADDWNVIEVADAPAAPVAETKPTDKAAL